MGPAVDIPGAPSQRVRLARAALTAARSHPDVAGAHAGPDGLCRTADTGGMLEGVAVVAETAGRYSVDLRLVARLVPLYALAGQVEELVRHAAIERGLGPVLGSVTVRFEDITEGTA